MKSPQLENGYFKISNELFDALIAYRIPGEQRQCLDFIIRKTYGFNKKKDFISNKQFCIATGLKHSNVSRAIRGLIDKNIVIKKDTNYVPSYEFNKHYKTWKCCIKKDTCIKKATIRIKKDTNLVSKKMDTKDIKYTLQKTPIFDIFEYWNAAGIIVHRKMTAKMEGHVSSKLEVYSVEEIRKTIENYGAILNSKTHWPTYKWTLSEFLTRENGFEKYHDDAKPFENFKKFEKGGNGKNKIPGNIAPEKRSSFEKLILIAAGKAGHEIVNNYANVGESTEEMQKRASRELERLRRG